MENSPYIGINYIYKIVVTPTICCLNGDFSGVFSLKKPHGFFKQKMRCKFVEFNVDEKTRILLIISLMSDIMIMGQL